MNKVEKALENHHKGYNCAQAVLCAFADVTDYTEDQLFRLSEGFGFGMGTQGTCGAVSAMVFLAGLKKSRGVDAIPETNKKESYELARELINSFEEKNKSIICKEIRGDNLRSCDGCIEDAVKILEEKLK
ncbi:MAG: C_GCAxxG_C_C family protein [Clostridia bacterium]|nr:C_GCAxxG_C_C family protein [Clostridia bacterium]